MKRRQSGMTLVEVMVTLVIVGVITAGIVGFFAHYRASSHQQEDVVSLQNNLRAASDHITSQLRRAGYGMPQSMLPLWVDWVDGFQANPQVTAGASVADPDTLTVASCTARPVAYVAETLAAGVANTTVMLESALSGKGIAELIDPASGRGLIRFGAGASLTGGFALVTATPGAGTTAAVLIDTDPGTAGNQGFAARSFFPGTPVCRVDVVTYTVDRTARTLKIDEHHGDGPQAAFDGFTNLKITGTAPTLAVTVTGETDSPPVVSRSLRTDVSTRNP